MSSGWFPNTRKEWIELIIAIIVLWLLTMVAIHELELVSLPDQWRLNLATSSLPPESLRQDRGLGGG
jgi:hypothetical protein